MRYRAAAVVLALAAAVAIGQVPMYSDYPWGLLSNGTDQGPVYNLDCRNGLWCHLNGYGNGVVELGDGGVLPVTVLFAQDAGQALLADFARDAGRARLAEFSDYAGDAGALQCTGCIDTTRLGALAVTTSKIATGAVTSNELGSAAVTSAKLATGAVDNAALGDLSISSGKLQDSAVTTAKVGALAIDSTKLAAAAVTTAKLATGAVDNAALGDLSISAGKLQDSAVTTSKLNALAVDSSKLAAAAVTTAKLATGAVTANELGAAAVTTSKIATGAVTSNELGSASLISSKFAPGSIDTFALDAGCITSAKFSAGAVDTAALGAGVITSAKFAAGAVDNTALGDLSISSAKLQDSAVTTAKLNALAVDSTKLAAGAVTTAKIASGAVTSTELGAAAVTTAKLATGAVTANELGSGAVTSAKLAAGAVDTTALGAGAVTSAKLGAGAVDSTALGAGAVTTAKLATGAVTANELGALAVTTAKIASGAVTTNELGAGAVTTAKLGSLAVATGNIQAGAVTTTELGASAVTTAKLADLSATAAKLDNGIALSAYDEATPQGIVNRTTATNCTKGTYDGSLGYIRYTIGTTTTNPQVSSTLYTGTSTNLLTTAAVVRYRISAGAVGKVSALTAINNAATAQTATAVFLADGNWHTAVFDLSAWTTAGTLRVDLTLSSNLATTGYLDISYMATGIPGGGTGALVSYQGAVGIGVPTPGDALEVVKSASSGWTAQFTNSSAAANTTKTVGVELRGTDTTGTEKQAATIRATPEDNNYVASGLSFSTRTGDAVAERVAISGAGVVTINKPSSGNNLNITGTDTVVAGITTTSNTAASFPQLQVLNYGANGGYPVLATYMARGTLASPASPNSGDSLGAWIAYGRTLSSFTEGGRIQWTTTAAPGTTTLTTALDLYTSNNATSSAKARLSAAGKLYIGGAADAEELLEVRSGSSAYGWLHSNGTIKVGSYISTEGQLGTKSNHDFGLFTNNGAVRLRITATGETRVVSLAGTGNRAVYSDANGALTNTSSDGTLKTDVEDLRAPLRMVLNLRPVTFRWKDTARFGEQRELGFIAQEVMQVIPEVVGRNSDGTYTVDYPKIVAALAGAVQELYEDRTAMARRVQQLEDRAQQAEDKLAQLEARMAALEAWSGMAGCPPDCEPAGARPGNGQRP